MVMYVLYGISASSLDGAAAIVNKVLKIELEARESGVIGDYYGFGRGAEERVKIKYKVGYDQDEQYVMEPDFPGWDFFVYVDGAELTSHYLAALDASPSQFKKLRTNSE